MVVLLKTLQVILALSVLIIIHEFGHFIYSKIFGIRVEKFFLFFDIGGVKLFSTKTGWFARLFPSAKNWETEYGIGWLPTARFREWWTNPWTWKVSGRSRKSGSSARNRPGRGFW